MALGSNLGDRGWNLRRALHALRRVINIVRVSTIHESAAVDAPEGSPPFLNLVLLGTTALAPATLLAEILAIETRLGRARRRIRNEPRLIDIDLILHGATRMRTRALTLPHPRAREREFVMGPLREVGDVFWSAVAAATAFVCHRPSLEHTKAVAAATALQSKA